ncbi:MAG: protein phosphatase 2C domain-containing protein [Pseudomonadota bacterium]
MFKNVRHFEKSDIGLQRRNNEDSLLIVDQHCNHYDLQKYGMFFVVADGMGGHAAGEIASKMACEEAVSAYYHDDLSQTNVDDSELKIRKLEKSIRSAHGQIISAAREQKELRGMGTTLSALVLTENKALIAHIGDSRIYRYRKKTCERMTVDHTKNQDLIDSGKIQPGHENSLYYGYILTQALGGYDDLTEVFTRVENVQRGDVFLLCTDGLHDLVTDNEIQEILTANLTPQTTCDELVQTATRKGGNDDITVIVIQL